MMRDRASRNRKRRSGLSGQPSKMSELSVCRFAQSPNQSSTKPAVPRSLVTLLESPQLPSHSSNPVAEAERRARCSLAVAVNTSETGKTVTRRDLLVHLAPYAIQTTPKDPNPTPKEQLNACGEACIPSS